MIPENISYDHVISAINYVDINGVPPRRVSTKYVLNYKGKDYPPKYLISLANEWANGEHLSSALFTGGSETNNVLTNLGFTISEIKIEYPVLSDSWTILTPNIFIKLMDKSSFLHHGTAIPRNIRHFFIIDDIAQGQRIDVALVFMDVKYEAYFFMDTQDTPRTRLLWKSDFSGLIRERFPEWHDYFSKDTSTVGQSPEMRFHKRDDLPGVFFVDFIYPSEIEQDLTYDVEENSNHNVEGSHKYFYSKKYERNPENRRKAVEIHGTVCSICGFDFEKHYGIRGRGFIEIHHTTPLHSLEQEICVNPSTDLIPVCSNCHRMIHRRRENILSIEEMINIFNAD